MSETVTTPTKKIIRKKVKVKQYEMTKRHIDVSKYNKFQLWIAKLFKLDLLDAHKYVFRIEYYGQTRLKPKQAVVNSQGVVFVVLREQNRVAILVTLYSCFDKPNLYGDLTLLEE
jgi:hypothetical protein